MPSATKPMMASRSSTRPQPRRAKPTTNFPHQFGTITELVSSASYEVSLVLLSLMLMPPSVHIYFLHTDSYESKFANELWERIRRECKYSLCGVRSILIYYQVPELRIYRVWDKPIGPHPMAMFEVNIFTPGKLSSLSARNFTNAFIRAVWSFHPLASH